MAESLTVRRIVPGDVLAVMRIEGPNGIDCAWKIELVVDVNRASTYDGIVYMRTLHEDGEVNILYLYMFEENLTWKFIDV